MSLLPEDAPTSIYGPDGEPRFFSDPAIDRLIPVMLNLASELWIQTEQVETLHSFLLDKGLSTEAELEKIARRDDAEREAQLSAFLSRVFEPLREAGD
nr:hypothetical protein [Sphingomonas sp. Y57]